jgi:hypothetical protein
VEAGECFLVAREVLRGLMEEEVAEEALLAYIYHSLPHLT